MWEELDLSSVTYGALTPFMHAQCSLQVFITSIYLFLKENWACKLYVKSFIVILNHFQILKLSSFFKRWKMILCILVHSFWENGQLSNHHKQLVCLFFPDTPRKYLSEPLKLRYGVLKETNCYRRILRSACGFLKLHGDPKILLLDTLCSLIWHIVKNKNWMVLIAIYLKMNYMHNACIHEFES